MAGTASQYGPKLSLAVPLMSGRRAHATPCALQLLARSAGRLTAGKRDLSKRSAFTHAVGPSRLQTGNGHVGNTKPARNYSSGIPRSGQLRGVEAQSSKNENSPCNHGQTIQRDKELSMRVKTLMRCVPQPVAIVTSTEVVSERHDGPVVWRGATISSFNTVVIEPQPVVSFNFKRPSSTFDAICSSGYFCVHLLTESQPAAELASRFTKGNASSPFQDLLVQCSSHNETQDSLEATPIAYDPPVITGINGSPTRSVAFSLRCRYLAEKTVTVGDHVVLFGIVTEAEVQASDTPGMSRDKPETCLTYANGRFCQVMGLEQQEANT